MKKESRKLQLDRETLIPLQNDELADVNGGITPTITTSSAACIGASSAIITSVIGAISLSLNSRGCK